MKFLFMADLHCHNHEQFHTRLPNGRNSRLQDCLNVIAQAKQYVLDFDVKAVWILGDVFHARTKIDVDVFTSTWQAIADLATAANVYILRGNHDSYSKIGEVHSLEPFKSIPNVTVVDEPTTFIDFGCRIHAYPYSANVKGYVDYWKECPPFDLLLLHQSIKEAAIGPYAMTGHGELSVADLPTDRFKFIFAGDYHKRQWFGPQNRVHYIGSPLQLNFGERDEEKAFTLLDTTTWDVSSLPTKAPRFFQFDSAESFKCAAYLGQCDPQKDFIRVVTEDAALPEIAEAKSEFSRIQIVETKPEQQSTQRVGQEIVGDDASLLEAYVRENAGALDQVKLLATGIGELLGE